jgi:hypothetical protein
MRKEVAALTESNEPDRPRDRQPNRSWAEIPREILTAVTCGLVLEAINELLRLLG